MAKYIVKSPLKYKGKRHAPGKTVDITEDDVAEQLVENGTVESAKEPKPAEKKVRPNRAPGSAP